MHTKYVEGFSCQAMRRAGWAKGIADWRVRRASACWTVASSQSWRNSSRTRSARTPTVPSSPRSIQGVGWEPATDQGLAGFGHHRSHVEQLGDALIGPSLGDDHSAIGVPAQHDGRLGLGDRLPGVDIGVEIAETVPGLAAAGQRHRDARDSVACERFGHLAPPPGRVADARAVHEDQRRHGTTSLGRKT